MSAVEIFLDMVGVYGLQVLFLVVGGIGGYVSGVVCVLKCCLFHESGWRGLKS